MIIFSNEESAEASDSAQDSCQEIVMMTEEEFETQVLDGQTEIYNFEPTGNSNFLFCLIIDCNNNKF